MHWCQGHEALCYSVLNLLLYQVGSGGCVGVRCYMTTGGSSGCVGVGCYVRTGGSSMCVAGVIQGQVAVVDMLVSCVT